MKKQDYLSILQQNVTFSGEKLGLEGNWIFQQDNDPKQFSKIVKEWLLYRKPKVFHNPHTLMLWEYVDKKVRELNISCVTERMDQNSIWVHKQASGIKLKGGQTKY